MTLADRIVVLRAGVVEQVGAPLELYNHPDNAFVAGFIGSPKMNFVPTTVTQSCESGLVLTLPDGSSLSVPRRAASLSAGDQVSLGIRPQDLARGTGDIAITVDVDLVEALGGTSHVHGRALGVAHFIAEQSGAVIAENQQLDLALDSTKVHLFDRHEQRVDTQAATG